MTSPPQHDDPLGEARAQILQVLAVFSTVGEAAARYAAAGMHSAAARTERRADAARLQADGHHRADQLDGTARTQQDAAARRLIDKAFNERWLAKAAINDLAQLWRTAALLAATGDARAREAMRLAETRLHRLNPILMDAYANYRAAGMNLTDAMRAAAHDVWQHERSTRARPHGNAPYARPSPKPIGTAPDPHGQAAAELDTAVAAEVARLAAGVDADLIDRVQRQWRSAGHAPAADAAGVLANAARLLRADAQLGGPTVATATIRRGVNHPTSVQRPPDTISHDSADVPIRTAATGYLLAADGLDQTAREIRVLRAEQAHLAAQADQQLRRADIDQAQPDRPDTPVDEHHDGQHTGHAGRGRAEHDQATVAQLHRFGQAFPPLRTITPTFSHPTRPTGPSDTPRRRGTNR